MKRTLYKTNTKYYNYNNIYYQYYLKLYDEKNYFIIFNLEKFYINYLKYFLYY